MNKGLCAKEIEEARELLAPGKSHIIEEKTVQGLLVLASRLLTTVDADTERLESLGETAVKATILGRNLGLVLTVVGEILEEYTSDEEWAEVSLGLMGKLKTVFDAVKPVGNDTTVH